MNEVMEELRANMASDEISNILDGQGAQDDADVIEEGLEETNRPEIDYS